MDNGKFLTALEAFPIIAAVKDAESLALALKSECRMVFVLYGSVLNIAEIAAQIDAADKICVLHLDLIEGLAPRDVSVDYVAMHTGARGIISTRQSLVKRAAAQGLFAVQRFFLLDSLAISNIQRQHAKDAAAFEVLPGLMPKMIRKITQGFRQPIIAGGLISEKEDVVQALNAGAHAVSSTAPDVWYM